MSQTMKILFVALLVVACNGSAPSTAPPQAPSPKPAAQVGAVPPDVPADQRGVPATIILEKVEKACQVVAAATTVSAKHGQAVVWLVRNRCGAQQTVALGSFHEKEGGAEVDPFEKGPSRSCIAQANGSCTIVLVVLPNDPHPRFVGERLNKVYTYDFSRKGEDPELVIEWP
jgi:hypothetical protein